MAGLTFSAKPPPKRVAHPNADLYGMLRDAYNEHMLLLGELDLADAATRELRRRVRNGEAWLRRHGSDHARSERNRALLDRLRDELRQLTWRQRDLKVARMGAALEIWDCYAGLTEIERAAAHEIGIKRVMKPDREKYEELLTHWNEMSDIVEIPFR